MTEFNLIDIFQRAFNSTSFPFPDARTNGTEIIIGNGFAVSIADQPESVKTSVLGTPIFMPLTIDGYEFPNEPLVKIKGTKSIVRTPVAGYSGTVKEDMGLNDYEITIRGLVVNNDSDAYPEVEVQQIRALYEKRESLVVVNPIFSLFNIDSIAIESLMLPAVEGYQNVQAYEIKGYSDRSIELVVNTDQEIGF